MRAIRNRAEDVFLAISLVLGPLLARLFLVAVRIRVESAFKSTLRAAVSTRPV